MSLNRYLDRQMDKFIVASINRASVSSDRNFLYRISADSIKEAVDIQRLHEATVTNYLTEHYRVDASYDDRSKVFFIELDLDRCVLDPSQAKILSEAMELFRAQNM